MKKLWELDSFKCKRPHVNGSGTTVFHPTTGDCILATDKTYQALRAYSTDLLF